MIRYVAAAILLVATNLAHAGIVHFTPPEVVINQVDPIQDYVFSVFVDSEAGGATSMERLHIAFASALTQSLDFQFSDRFLATTEIPSGVTVCIGNDCGSAIFISGRFSEPQSLPFLVGTLSARIDFREKILSGNPFDDAIFVDTNRTHGYSNLDNESLNGSVRLVPEPATIILLLAGMLALMPRSRTVIRDDA